MRRFLLPTVLGAIVVLAATPAIARYTGKDAVGLIKVSLRRCSGMKVLKAIEAFDAEDGPSARDTLEARKRPGLLEVSIGHIGDGVDAQHETTTWRVQVARCRAIGMRSATVDGQIRWRPRFLRDRRAAPTAREKRELLVQAGFSLGRRGKATFGAAAILAAKHRCGKPVKRGWALSRRLAPAQRAHRGKPRGCGLTAFLRGKRALAVSWVRKPRADKRLGRYTVYLASLAGRSADQALAVYDEKKKRHRWIVQTRACTTGKITWLGERGDVLVAKTTPTHPIWLAQHGESLIFLRLSTGRAHRLLLPTGPAASLSVKVGAQSIVVRSTLVDRKDRTSELTIPWRAVQRKLGVPRVKWVERAKKTKRKPASKGASR